MSIRRRVDLPEPEGPSKGDDFSGNHFEIGGDNLNTVPVRLDVELLHTTSA